MIDPVGFNPTPSPELWRCDDSGPVLSDCHTTENKMAVRSSDAIPRLPPLGLIAVLLVLAGFALWYIAHNVFPYATYDSAAYDALWPASDSFRTYWVARPPFSQASFGFGSV